MSAPKDELSKKDSPASRSASPRSRNLDYASRPKFDRLGNPLIDRTAMSAYGGAGKIRLPGDLGAKDPRRPKSPAPSTLPGDLGPNDPRRPRSTNSSPAPSAGHSRNASYESSEAGAGRLEEDPPRPEDEQQASDEDADADNDNDTDRDDEGRGRGRKRPEPGRTTSGKSVGLRDESVDSEADVIKPDPTKGESKLSFARDPRLKVSSPGGKKRVHPSTAFDAAPSGPSTPLGSDDESHSELRAAQKLSLTTSAVHSTPSAHRVIRQIIRGDYAHFQREAEEGRRRQRMYLVSTDLSPESEYALEWTIGTVLRDGDTLFAVYASDLETVAGSEKGEGVEIGHGAESVEDTAATLRALPATTIPPHSPSPLAKSAASETRSRSRGVYSAAETERRRAIEEITAKCIMLLRKTRLQVRVVVEVFHCKSPRHMITEVIDFLSPTLVVIGSRGRSAVKGVLLGSFSNYLVTKSSVPVMVARKKLRKHSKSDKRNPDGTVVPYSGSGRTGRFSNVIEAPRGKGLRVQGWDKVGID
ncbi:adenine nucleotide alpha hydrolases-like protein [Teratosphaeria nubilosa]|uniref:Adenine nucleotide alpha hydrolases-like protein n=1 Tax=Teratosphaeria nubilosa TaxID=161662 RepID=A0A6G1KWK7_9PEZI|nr:adenine nucleotide alpha hydrolases-like protein [Teratosphaeria nubilosa]